MENNQITLLKTLEFPELYEKTNVQRPLTIFEWAIAKEMYMDFIEGTEIEKEYKPFDPDTSSYIPLIDNKTWAFRDMG